MVFVYIIGLAAGVLVLVKGADWFTNSAVEVARRLGVPEIIVGATIVSLATTLPEFAVSFVSALYGKTDFAVGNAVGSTICNVGLILGFCAVLSPMGVARRGFMNSGIGLLVLAIIFGALGYAFPEGSRWTGAVMVVCLVLYLAATLRAAIRYRDTTPTRPVPEMTRTRIIMLFAVGTLLVAGGSRLMVACGVELAELMGVPKLIIGLTFLAIGTSIPEFTVSITSIIKKQRGLSIGNIIGANILNLAWVIGASSLVIPLPVRLQTRQLDIPVMVLLSLLLLVFGLTDQRLSRWEGGVLLGIYIAYLAVLFIFFGAPDAAPA